MADILDEVEGDYRAEQLRQAAARYAWVGALALVLVLLAVGGWQLWQARQARTAAAAASAYLDASRTADSTGDTASRTAAAQRLLTLAAHSPPGYRTLARLRAAALLADAGNLAQAQSTWDQISTDPQAEPLLRQLASLLWVQRGLDRSDPAALRTRLVSLTTPDTPYHALGQEAQALLELRLNHTEAARKILRRIAADPTAPAGVRGRDGAMLSRLGG